MEVRVGVANNEFVAVGRCQVFSKRVVVYEVSEEERGLTGALWYSHPHVSVWGGGVVGTTGNASSLCCVRVWCSWMKLVLLCV